MKKNNKYWYLLIPIAAVIVAAIIILIPRNKHHDWDDEDEEENRTERSDFDITDEDIAAIPEGEPPVWGGNSPAVHVEPVPGITIDARENAFDRPTTVKFRPATTEEHEELSEAISQQLPSHSLLFAFDLDAGIEPMHRAPGNFSVDLDLEKLDIPEELWERLRVCRLDETGIVQQYSRTLNDGIFRFETSKNCLWGIALTGLGLATSGTATTKYYIAAIGSLPYAIYWMKLGIEYGTNGVELEVDDPAVGLFTIGFNPYDTEHPHPDKYMKGLKRIQNIEASLRVKARRQLDNERQQDAEHSFSLWSNSNAIRDSIRYQALLTSMAANHNELQDLLADKELATPKSIENIKMMILYAKRYLKDVARVKEPGDISKFFLASSTLTSGGDGSYVHFLDICPMIAVYYKGRYVSGEAGNKTVATGYVAEDCLKVTIAHELFHHHQSAYVWFSLFRSKTWDECTASVIERSYAKWMYDQRKLAHDPAVTDLGFSNRDNKEWLFAPLDNSLIVPTGFDPSLVGQLYKKTAMKLMVDIKDMIKGNRPVNFEELERVLFESVSPLFPQLRRVEMLRDVFGYYEAATHNYGNCEKGYMLGELYEYIRDNYVPDARLHDFLMYGTGFTDMMFFTAGWNIANAFKMGFHVEEAFLSRAFNEYCQTVMKDIVKRQTWLMSEGDNAGNSYTYYYNQAFKPYLPVSRQQPVVKLQCWERAGMFACRTATLDPADGELYNLFLVPHMNTGREEAVKAFVLKNDSAYSSTPYYLECDSNGMKSPTSVALLFTDQIKGQGLLLSLNEYYDAVAFYAPKEKPAVEMVSGGGVRLRQYEQPSPELKRNGYVTGMAYTVRNNKTGRENTMLKLLGDTEPPVMAIPDYQAGEEADITAYCRWYYKPCDNESTIYYSPNSDIEMASGREEQQSGTIVDREFKMTMLLWVPLEQPLDQGDQETRRAAEEWNKMLETKAHLTVGRDGNFTLTVNALDGSFSGNEGGVGGTMSFDISAITIKGKGTLIEKPGRNQIEISDFDASTLQCTPVTAHIKSHVTTKNVNDELESEDDNMDLEITLNGEKGVLTLTATDSDLSTITSFNMTMLDCKKKGKHQTKEGDKPWETKDVDEKETMNFAGRIP
ncbi:MAG: hypothetical protein J5797_05830 [Prevotella sp.]|nr:hypothetical protein [Prevotella sp.]